MRKYFRLLLTVILLSQNGWGQKKILSELDSLQVLSNKPKSDKASIDATIDICRYYLERGIYDSVNVYAQKSLLLANNIQYEKGIGNAFFYKGFAVGAYGNYDSTETYWRRSEKFLQMRRIRLVSYPFTMDMLYYITSEQITVRPLLTC